MAISRNGKTPYYNKVDLDPGVLKSIIEERTVEYTKKTNIQKSKLYISL
jgi:hypothetical protein